MGDSTVITPEFRGNYVNLFKPKAMAGSDKEKYGMLVALPGNMKSTKQFIDKLTALINAKMVEKFGKIVKSPKHWPIIDGDSWNEAEDDDTKENPFAGMTLIRCSSNFKPEVVDMQGLPVVKESDLYSGAWYRVSLAPWAWSGEFGRGISISLESALKIRDDDRIGGGGAPAKKTFATYLEDAEAEDDEDDGDEPAPVKKKVVIEDEDEDDEPAPVKKKKKVVIEDDEDGEWSV